MSKGARTMLAAAWALAVLPWFWLVSRDLVAEIRAPPGEMSDAPYHYAAFALIRSFAPWSGAFLLIAVIVSVYLWIRDPPMRRRIGVWFAVLLAGIAAAGLGLGPASLRSKALSDGIDTAWLGALLALAFW